MFTEMSADVTAEFVEVARWIMYFCIIGAALAARKGNAPAAVPSIIAAILAGMVGYPEAFDAVIAFIVGLLPGVGE